MLSKANGMKRFSAMVGIFAVFSVLLLSGCAETPRSPRREEPITTPVGVEKPKLDPTKVPMSAFFPMKGPETREYTLSLGLKTAKIRMAYEQPRSSGAIRYVPVTSTRYAFDVPTKPGEKPKPPKVEATVKETYFWVPGKGLFLTPGAMSTPGPLAVRILPERWEESYRWEGSFTTEMEGGRKVPGKYVGKLGNVERVATPAGDFDAVHTEVTRVVGIEPNVTVEEFDFWFAKDVGIVKTVYVTRTGKLSMLLAKRGQ